MKPKTWRRCPWSILERWLKTVDFGYVLHDYTTAEIIHGISNNYIPLDISRILKHRWSAMSEEEFNQRCLYTIDYLEKELSKVKKLVKG